MLNLTNLIYLDQKFRDTSGNRTDETLKNVLLSTFSGMFSTIPFLAVTKVSLESVLISFQMAVFRHQRM